MNTVVCESFSDPLRSFARLAASAQLREREGWSDEQSERVREPEREREREREREKEKEREIKKRERDRKERRK